MDNFNHNIIEQLEAEVKNKHYHEELVLQGKNGWNQEWS